MTELDLVFICDTTGSMGSYLNAAKKSIEKIVTTITQSEKCDVRFALVEYRDHPPQDSSFFAFRLTDFTASMKEIQRAVDQMRADGGGDGPESVACAFHCASELKYREKATKVAVWIADAPPHGFSPNSGDGFEKDVHVDMILLKLTLMRAVAEMTGGQYAALASADVLGDLITAGAIEEIQINKMLIKVRKTLEEDPEFVALNPKKKSYLSRFYFSVEPEAVPDIFKNAENLKQLKNDGYGSGGYDDIFGCECLDRCYDDDELVMKCDALPKKKKKGGLFSFFSSSPKKTKSDAPCMMSSEVTGACPPPAPLMEESIAYPSAAPMMKQEVKSVKRKADAKQTSRMETRMKSYYGDY
ncbi:VWFA domain-containing protein [Entamoeba marina]